MFNNKKSLESILSTFTKTIEDLDSLSDKNRDIATTKEGEIQELSRQRDALLDEANRASIVRSKINSLLS